MWRVRCPALSLFFLGARASFTYLLFSVFCPFVCPRAPPGGDRQIGGEPKLPFSGSGAVWGLSRFKGRGSGVVAGAGFLLILYSARIRKMLPAVSARSFNGEAHPSSITSSGPKCGPDLQIWAR